MLVSSLGTILKLLFGAAHEDVNVAIDLSLSIPSVNDFEVRREALGRRREASPTPAREP